MPLFAFWLFENEVGSWTWSIASSAINNTTEFNDKDSYSTIKHLKEEVDADTNQISFNAVLETAKKPGNFL